VGVRPRIVSHWRRRFAAHGVVGHKDRPRGGKKPIYGQATNTRILALLDKPPPSSYGRWTGPLLAKVWGDVQVQYVWRFLREHTIDLAGRKSWCESSDPQFAAKAPMWSAFISIRGQSNCSVRRQKTFDPSLRAGARLSGALTLAKPRLRAA
jgi:hypothetical protein